MLWSGIVPCRRSRSVRRSFAADERHFRLDGMEEGLVNVESGMPQDEHSRADQAVRNRNHGIAVRRRRHLGLEARRRSQHAADDDAPAYDDRAMQIRRPYGRKQVRERR